MCHSESGFLMPGTAHASPFFCGTVAEPTCCPLGHSTLFRKEFVCLTGDSVYSSLWVIVSIFNASKVNLIEI